MTDGVHANGSFIYLQLSALGRTADPSVLKFDGYPHVAPRINDFISQLWAPKPLITAGGYTRDSAMERTQSNENELIAFGKLYISNVSTPPSSACISLLTTFVRVA